METLKREASLLRLVPPKYDHLELDLFLGGRALKRAMAEINKKLSTHIARHTFATTITLSNDVPIETISKMLGHSRIQTTQIYARVLDKKVEHDMGKLNAKFNF